MSGLAVLLLAASGAAWGAWASLRRRSPLRAGVPSAALFAAAGVLAVLVSWVAGDGVVLPGLQVSPGLRAYYLSETRWGLAPRVTRWLLLAAPLAHLLLVAWRRDRPSLLLPAPATAVFLWLIVATPDETVAVVRARGPEDVAYLTIASRGEGARLIVAAGDPFAAFLRVLHVHDTEVAPRELLLHWTKDGQALAVRVEGDEWPSFAVDLEGRVTGGLPAEAREWSAPGAYVPGDVDRRFREFRKDVSILVDSHGGLLPP